MPTKTISYAAQIWTAGDFVYLNFPSPERGARSHTISLPSTQHGWAAINSILRERERMDLATQHISTKAALTQQMADALVKALKAGKSIDKKPSARKIKIDDSITLEDLGL